MKINLNSYARVRLTVRGLENLRKYISRTGINVEYKEINEEMYVAICIVQTRSITEILGYNHRNEYDMNIEVE